MLNENLVKIRKERGLTQEALAIKLDVVRQTISKWEKGTSVPDADTLLRIAAALDVSVSVLLGDLEHEDETDTALIAKALAQINEQLAIRNRHLVTVWKIVCFISFVFIGILIGKIGRIYFENDISKGNQKVVLPDMIEVSNVCFNGDSEEMVCSFVPSIGNSDFVFKVTLYGHDNSFPCSTAVVAKYENGICTARFDISKLSKYLEYSVILNVEYKGDVRNLTLAKAFHFQKNGYSWETQ